MASYMSCLRSSRGFNAPDCRELSKAYLQCRMDKGLMAVDEMKNLGFGAAAETPGGGQKVQREAEGR